MKTIRNLLLLTLLLAPVLISCEQEEPNIEMDGTLSFDIPAAGGSQTVSFTTNYDWEASSADPWIQVSPSSGKKGYASLTIRVEANDTGKSRKGGVSVQCQTLRKSISVSQQANLTQSLVIKHTNASFRIPVISGNGLTGKFSWGDGAEETYSSSLNHTYSSTGNHTVTIKLNGGTSFDLETITGITDLDVTSF